jgi:hypothetical protein
MPRFRNIIKKIEEKTCLIKTIIFRSRKNFKIAKAIRLGYSGVFLCALEFVCVAQTRVHFFLLRGASAGYPSDGNVLYASDASLAYANANGYSNGHGAYE